MSTVREVIKHLKKYNKLDDIIVAHIWTVEDVMEQAKNDDITITEDEAGVILEQMEDDLDSNDGITWETISFRLQDYREAENE